jgi:predicted RND superfamily exporter protein
LILSFSALAKFFKADQLPIPKPLFGDRPFPMIPVPRGLALACAGTAVVMLLATQVHFQYDFEKMMKHSSQMEETSHLIDEIYQRSAVPSALSVQTKLEALEVEKAIKDKYMPSLVAEVLSGASIVPENQSEKEAIIERIRTQLAPIKDRWIEKSLGVPAAAVRNWVNAKPFKFQDMPLHLQDALRGTKNEGYLLYVYPSVPLGDAVNIAKYAGMLKAIEAQFPDLLMGSDAVIFSDILDLIRRDGSIILVVIFLSVGFFIWLNTRRLGDTVASYAPLLLALIVGMGLMAIFGVPFNILNITIIPSFVALGIDVPIHLVHRAHETGSGFKAARDMAPSINLAIGTSAIGFGILIFARAGVLRSLGEIALLGTIAIWWVGLFLLAAVLEWRLRRRSRRNSISPANQQSGSLVG